MCVCLYVCMFMLICMCVCVYGHTQGELVTTFFEDGDEYKALPEHPLDDHFELVWYKLVGPLGKFRRGPFRAAGGAHEGDSEEDDDDW